MSGEQFVGTPLPTEPTYLPVALPTAADQQQGKSPLQVALSGSTKIALQGALQ